MPTVRLDPALIAEPAAVAELTFRLARQGNNEAAVALIEQALKNDPSNRMLKAVEASVLSRSLPSYHRSMLADLRRNAGYKKAIEATVRPGDLVLDIGTGSGLLAMMAAEAGAERVVSCEVNPVVADVARKIIAKNGFADKIEVITGYSIALDQAQVGGPFDVIVSEIFDADAVSEGFLPSIRDAWKRFAKSDTRFVPERCAVVVALAECHAGESPPLGNVLGFDLGEFATLFPRNRYLSRGEALTMRSDPRCLFELDLCDPSTLEPRTTKVALNAHGGHADAIVQWLEISLTAGVDCSNSPEVDRSSSWMRGAWSLGAPVATAKGEEFLIGALLSDDRLLIWPE